MKLYFSVYRLENGDTQILISYYVKKISIYQSIYLYSFFYSEFIFLFVVPKLV